MAVGARADMGARGVSWRLFFWPPDVPWVCEAGTLRSHAVLPGLRNPPKAGDSPRRGRRRPGSRAAHAHSALSPASRREPPRVVARGPASLRQPRAWRGRALITALCFCSVHMSEKKKITSIRKEISVKISAWEPGGLVWRSVVLRVVPCDPVWGRGCEFAAGPSLASHTPSWAGFTR